MGVCVYVRTRVILGSLHFIDGWQHLHDCWSMFPILRRSGSLHPVLMCGYSREVVIPASDSAAVMVSDSALRLYQGIIICDASSQIFNYVNFVFWVFFDK